MHQVWNPDQQHEENELRQEALNEVQAQLVGVG